MAHFFESADIIYPPQFRIGFVLFCRMQLQEHEMPLSAAFQQMGCVFQAGFGKFGAAQHACNLLCPL
jgi:hypothetical protein